MNPDGVRYGVPLSLYAVSLTAYDGVRTAYCTACADGVPAYDRPRRGSYAVRRRLIGESAAGDPAEGKEKESRKDVDGCGEGGMVAVLPDGIKKINPNDPLP